MYIIKLDHKNYDSTSINNNFNPVFLRLGKTFYKVSKWEELLKIFYHQILKSENGQRLINNNVNKYIFYQCYYGFISSNTVERRCNYNYGYPVKISDSIYTFNYRSLKLNITLLFQIANKLNKRQIELYVYDSNNLGDEYEDEYNKLIDNIKTNYKLKNTKSVISGINKMIYTEEEMLTYNIAKQFDKCTLIGDIVIPEGQEVLLNKFMSNTLNRILYNDSPNNIYNDDQRKAFLYGMVRYGMKYYNKKGKDFWPYISQEYDIDKFPGPKQTILHEYFESWCLRFNKAYDTTTSNKIDNITMHGFVSDHSSTKFFNYLFDFWRIDLQGHIEALYEVDTGKELFNELIESIKRNPQGIMKHTYMLSQSDKTYRIFTLRVRNVLKQINESYWYNSSIVHRNRLYILLEDWLNDENGVFQKDRNNIDVRISREKGNVNYRKPTLSIDEGGNVCIILPQQRLVGATDEDYPIWTIESDSISAELPVTLYEDLLGYYIKEEKISVPHNYLLETFRFVLKSNDHIFKKYKINSSNFKLFDKNGRYINHELNIIPEGNVICFSKSDTYPININQNSQAEEYGTIYEKNFDLMNGDVLIDEDQSGYVVGYKVTDSLIKSQPLQNITANVDGNSYIIYTQLPSILYLSDREINGTPLWINDTPYNMGEYKFEHFTYSDKANPNGYIVDLNDYIKYEGIYSIKIRFLKGGRVIDFGNFCYLKNFGEIGSNQTYKYRKSLYIFENEATIILPLNHKLTNKDRDNWTFYRSYKTYTFDFAEKNENMDTYCEYVNGTQIQFDYQMFDRKIKLNFDIPALFWKFNLEDEWNVLTPSDIPIKEFTKTKSKMYISGLPNIDHVYITASNLPYTVAYEESKIYATKENNNYYFVLNRIYDWFREYRIHSKEEINICLGGVDYHLFTAITKSVFNDATLQADIDNDMLYGTVDLSGDGNYCITINKGSKTICHHFPLNEDHTFEYKCKISSGKYKLFVYEIEENDDDDIFGDSEPTLIELNNKPVELSILNIKNLEGKKINIYRLIDKRGILSHVFMKGNNVITSLRKTSYDEILNNEYEILGIWDDDIDLEDYELMNSFTYYHAIMGKHEVLLIFTNIRSLDSLKILRKEDDAYFELMYDINTKYFVLDENEVETNRKKIKKIRVIDDNIYKYDIRLEDEE